MNNSYNIYLGTYKLGTTSFEFTNSSKGIVFGVIDFKEGITGYDFLKQWCKNNNIELEIDLPEDQIMLTKSISPLTIKDEEGVTLHWISNQITGIADNDFELAVQCISCPVNYNVSPFKNVV